MLRGLVHFSGLETSVTDLARCTTKTPSLEVRGAERDGK